MAVKLDAMARKFPIHPAHPERTCWGCDRYCARDELACGNGSDRTQHPVEIFGDDWMEGPAARAGGRQRSQPEGRGALKSPTPLQATAATSAASASTSHCTSATAGRCSGSSAWT